MLSSAQISEAAHTTAPHSLQESMTTANGRLKDALMRGDVAAAKDALASGANPSARIDVRQLAVCIFCKSPPPPARFLALPVQVCHHVPPWFPQDEPALVFAMLQSAGECVAMLARSGFGLWQTSSSYKVSALAVLALSCDFDDLTVELIHREARHNADWRDKGAELLAEIGAWQHASLVVPRAILASSHGWSDEAWCNILTLAAHSTALLQELLSARNGDGTRCCSPNAVNVAGSKSRGGHSYDLLIEAGARGDVPGSGGFTMLMSASARQCRRLLELGNAGNLDCADKHGRTALGHAIYAEDVAKVDALLDAGASCDTGGDGELSTLWQCLAPQSEASYDMACIVLAHPGPVDIASIYPATTHGIPALVHAVHQPWPQYMALRLLERGAPVDRASCGGSSALVHVCQYLKSAQGVDISTRARVARAICARTQDPDDFVNPRTGRLFFEVTGEQLDCKSEPIRRMAEKAYFKCLRRQRRSSLVYWRHACQGSSTLE